MEDSLQLKRIDIQIKKNFCYYIARLAKHFNYEICGLICQNNIFFLKNKSADPKNYFIVDNLKYLEIFKKKSIDICFHSHPVSSATPSQADVEYSDNAGIPFLIYSVLENNFCLYLPEKQEAIYFCI